MLSDLDILVLDCQTTGSNPSCGQMLEIGWKHIPGAGREASNPSAIQSFVLRLPEGHTVPRRIQRMTGISQVELEAATPPKNVWKALLKEARRIAKQNRMELCPLVIHFSKFEEPFLRDMFAQFGGSSSFPFQIICTHTMSQRLLPHLPRKGIRAVAGYLGYSVPELKRSAHHVAATVFIWKALSQRLSEDGIESFRQLELWLHAETPKRSSVKEFPMKRELRLNLPDKPGVYQMLRSNGDVLYVGKAKSLKRRVNSYFRSSGQHGEHIKEMLTQAQDLRVRITETALEAALLENDEIKRLDPPYNVALRQRDIDPVFFSPDLASIGPSPDQDHPIGPIPTPGFLDPLGRLLSWSSLSRSSSSSAAIDCTAAAILGIPEEYAPPQECFLAGLQLFTEKYPDLGDRRNQMAKIQSLGTRLWAEHLERLALEAEKKGKKTEEPVDLEEEAPVEITQPRVWEPEMVLRGLEYTIRHGTFLLRRARWLCALSESSLCWEVGDGSDRSIAAVCIHISEGRIVARDSLAQLQEPHIPAGHKKSAEIKRQCFDRATYDRLRILATEIRRILAANRTVLLRLSANPPLRPSQLAKMLPWV